MSKLPYPERLWNDDDRDMFKMIRYDLDERYLEVADDPVCMRQTDLLLEDEMIRGQDWPPAIAYEMVALASLEIRSRKTLIPEE